MRARTCEAAGTSSGPLFRFNLEEMIRKTSRLDYRQHDSE
jgi:hypothetical protein